MILNLLKKNAITMIMSILVVSMLASPVAASTMYFNDSFDDYSYIASDTNLMNRYYESFDYSYLGYLQFDYNNTGAESVTSNMTGDPILSYVNDSDGSTFVSGEADKYVDSTFDNYLSPDVFIIRSRTGVGFGGDYDTLLYAWNYTDTTFDTLSVISSKKQCGEEYRRDVALCSVYQLSTANVQGGGGIIRALWLYSPFGNPLPLTDVSVTKHYTDGSILSSSLNTTNIIRSANITSSVDIPSGTTLLYNVSNDDGATWESATSGMLHIFTSRNNLFRYKLNVTNTNISETFNMTDISIMLSINDVPSVTSASISPSPANDSVNLVAVNGSTSDGNGDAVALFYRWYKDGIHQSSLDNVSTVLADNTTDDEVWKVGIIPNDGYINGTETVSATVTIGALNVAPTLSEIIANASVKYLKNITISSIGASDADGDNYSLSIGTSAGAADICIGTNATNGTAATCIFSIPWTFGTHAIYGQLSDGTDTSISYLTIVTVDTTPPVIGTTSLSSTSVLAGENLTITASVTVANGSISTVYAVINGANYAMSGSNGTYTYVFNTQAGGEYSVTYSATDDSGNIGYKLTPDSFQIVPSEGSGGGGGGGNITINETILGDLTISPPAMDSYFFYTGTTDIQFALRTFSTNRKLVSCEMIPNDIATCEITGANDNIIIVNISINNTMEAYGGTLSVIDESGHTATADIIIRVKNLFAAKLLSEPVYVGEELANILSPFATTKDGYITGLRWWAMITLLMILSAFVISYSNKL